MVGSKRQQVVIGLLIFLALIAWLTWRSVEQAVVVSGSSRFLVPAIFLSLVFVCLFLAGLLIQERSLRWLAASFVALTNLLTAFSWMHVGILMLAGSLISLGLARIQMESGERVQLALRKSMLAGTVPFVMALALILSSTYFVQIRDRSWEELVPSFNLAEGMGSKVLKVIAPLSPELSALNNENLTVDDFLGGIQEARVGKVAEALPSEFQRNFWAAEMARTKSEFGRLLGRPITGEERVASLLGEVLHRKTIALLSTEQQHLPVPVLPIILALLLFLTLYPLLSFVAPLLAGVAALGFVGIRHLGWIRVDRVAVEHEVIQS